MLTCGEGRAPARPRSRGSATLQIAGVCFALCAVAFAEPVWERPGLLPQATQDEKRLSAARWLWRNEFPTAPGSECLFRRAFDLPSAAKSAKLALRADDFGTIYLNGLEISAGRFRDGLKAGRNVLAVKVRNAANVAGLLFAADIVCADGTKVRVVSDAETKVAASAADGWERSDFDDSAWVAASDQGDVTQIPWSDRFDYTVDYATDAERAAIDAERRRIPAFRTCGAPGGSRSCATADARERVPPCATADARGIRRPEVASRSEVTRAVRVPPCTTEVSLVAEGHRMKIRLNGRTCEPDICLFNVGGIGHRYAKDMLLKAYALGWRLFEVPVNPSDYEKGKGVYDFTCVAKAVSEVVALAPEAYVSLSVNFDLPKWCAANPDETIRYADPQKGIRTGDEFNGTPVRPSAASRKYRAEVEKVICLLGERIAAEPWGRRVAIVRTDWGVYTEWHMFGMKNAPDVSRPMVESFGRNPPPVGVRRREKRVLDEKEDAELIAWNLHQQNEVADALIAFTSAVKKHIPGRLAGAYYGYIWDIFWPEGSNCLLGKVLDAPSVDFLSAPSPYFGAVRFGGGSYHSRSVPDAFRRRGKLFLCEDDSRHYHTKGWAFERHLVATPELSAAVMKRNYLNKLFDGGGIQFCDPFAGVGMRMNTFDDPVVLKALKEAMDVTAKAGTVPTGFSADVLVVVSERERLMRDSHVEEPGKPDMHWRNLYSYLPNHLYRSGVSVDFMRLEDFLADTVRPKTVLLLNAYHLTDAERATLAKRLAGLNVIDLRKEEIPDSAAAWRTRFERAGVTPVAPPDTYFRRQGNLVLFHTGAAGTVKVRPGIAGATGFVELFSGRRHPGGETLEITTDGPATLLFRAVTHAPYVAFACAPTNAVGEYVDLLPEKTYRASVTGAASAGLLFTDQDGRRIGREPLADGGEFTVPVQAMRAHLTAEFRPKGTVRIEQVADAPQDFNWNDWNSWTMRAACEGPVVFRRRFTVGRMPEYAFLRVWRESAAINGVPLGASSGAYVNDNYFDLLPHLRTGENVVEIRSTAKVAANAFCNLNADLHLRYADGRAEVILASDGKWECRPESGGAWTPVTDVASSWYNKDLCERPWVAPAELPPAILPRKWKVSAKAAFKDREVEWGECVEGRIDLVFDTLPYFTSNRFKVEWVSAAGEVVWHQWIVPDQDLRKAVRGTRLSVPVSLATRYLRPGHYALRLDGRCSSEGANVLSEVDVVGSRASRPVRSEYVPDRAVDVIRLDGQEMPLAMYYPRPYYPATMPRAVEDDIALFGKSGYRIFCLTAYLGIDRVKGSGPTDARVWVGPGRYDFDQLDEYARQILSVCPDAYIVLVMNADVPEWWQKAHPGESVILDDGTSLGTVSYASGLFQDEMAKALRDVAAHARNSFWGDRVALSYLVAGYDGQWFQPTEHRPPFRYGDYSRQQREHFQRWLKRTYGTEKDLSAAWGREVTSFEAVEIPTRRERVEGRSYYLDPVKDRPSIDFLRSIAALSDEVISKFMDAIAEGLGRKLPGGTYYIPAECTYFFGQVQRPCDEDIYSCGSYSFAAEPLGYDCHGLSQFGTGLRRLSRLQRLSGRFYVGEDDTRTFRSQPYNPRWGNPTAFGTLAGFRRNIAQRLTTGGAHWFLDIYGHWFDAPSIQRTIRRGYDIMALLGSYAPLRCLGAEAAQVRKVDTNLHKRINTQEDLRQVHYPKKILKSPHFTVDPLLWRNLGEHSSAELGYRVYLFDDLYALDESDLRVLENYKRDGNVLVFTHATGYSDMRTLSAENVSRAVGIRVEDDKPGQEFSNMTWTWTQGGAPLLQRGLPAAKRFNVTDGDVTVLGRFADGRIAAAMKKHGDWTAVYLPAAYPQGEVLDRIGALCGLHVYTDLPVNVGAGGRCVSVYCPVAEAKGTVRLPGRLSAVELHSGTCLFGVEEIPVDMSYGETRLYFIGDEDEVKTVARRTAERR